MALVMSDKELRRQLKSLGYSAGPITESTRSVYVKKFDQLQSESQQRERSDRRSRTVGQTKEADATLSRQARLRPSAASAGAPLSSLSSGAWRLQDDQDDEEPTAEPEADSAGSSADDFAERRHTGKWESVGGGRYSEPHRGTTSSHLYSSSSYSNPYARTFDSLSSERCTSNNQYSDPYTRIFDSLSSYKRDRLRSDQYPQKTDGLNSDRYAGKTDSPFSDQYAGKTDSLLTDRYAGKTGSTFSDRYAGKTDSLLTDRYAGKTGSTFSDRYAGKTDSLYSRRYTGITDSVNLDSCTGKYQGASSDPYARKCNSLFSDAYSGKFSDKNTRNLQGLYSDTRYRRRSDSWSENEDESHIHRTYGSVKNKNQKHKNRLVKFEFYLSRFLYISTIVLCLVLFALVCVKALGLVESQEDIDENIKMLPVDCHGKTDTFCKAEEYKMIMIILTEMYEYLAEMAGEFECGSESAPKSKCVPVIDVKTHLSILNVPNVNKFNEALQWIMQSPRDLGIRLVGEDSEATVTLVDQVTCLESTRPHMNLYCRLQRAFFTILNRMLIFITVLSLLWITLLLLKYYSGKMEEQQHDMYEMVNKIIAVIRAHNQDWEKDLELVPYVPIPHVRDTLIQPKDRKKMKKIWQKAVQFLEANESRIRTEKQRINGQDFLVWRWTQPSSLCDSM